MNDMVHVTIATKWEEIKWLSKVKVLNISTGNILEMVTDKEKINIVITSVYGFRTVHLGEGKFCYRWQIGSRIGFRLPQLHLTVTNLNGQCEGHAHFYSEYRGTGDI